MRRRWVCLTAMVLALGLAPAAQADRWLRGPDLVPGRYAPAAVTLADGDVLLAGGLVSDPNAPLTTTAVRYRPSTDTFLEASDMSVGRLAPVTATLSDGRVLVAGGFTGQGPPSITSGEVYDPVANTWTAVANELTVARARSAIGADASLLPDGRVLFATHQGDPSVVVEVYDPATNEFSVVEPLDHARSQSAQTVLADGRVLLVNGGDANAGATKGEVYDPATDTWTDTANDMSEPHYIGLATTLPDGKVLVGGGVKPSNGVAVAARASHLYDPATNSFTDTGEMHSPHINGAAATLTDGRVLALGGTDTLAQGLDPITDVAETYSAATGTWTQVARMDTAWDYPTAAVLGDGRVFVCCGTIGAGTVTRTQIYTPSYAPGAPRSVGAVAGDASATVTWAPPASDGNNPVLDYTVTASTGQQVTTADPSTSIAVTGLANGQPVTFTVTARTVYGTGPASAPSAPVTPGTPGGGSAEPDGTAPKVKLTGVKRKLRRKALLRGLRFTIAPDEPVKLSVKLLGSKRTKKPRYDVELASKAFPLGDQRKLTLKPKRARVNRAKRFKVRLRVVATDAAGNRRTITVTIKVSR